MLSPHPLDPNLAANRQDLLKNPQNWGYTGPRRVKAMVPVAQASQVREMAQSASPAPEPPPPPGPSQEELDAAQAAAEQARQDLQVMLAITRLQAKGAEFGKDGVPNVKQLSDEAGFKVSAEQRDRVWAQITAAPAGDDDPPDA